MTRTIRRASWGCAAAVSAFTVATLSAQAASAEAPARGESVMRIEVAGARARIDGACVLVSVEPRPGDVVLYLLTAAHLFSSVVLGEHTTATLRVTVTLQDGSRLHTSGSHAFFPSGLEAGVDIAVVRVVMPSTALAPAPVVFDPPEVGQLFTIVNPSPSAPRDLTQGVGFRSTRLIVGDRAVPDDVGLVGAPAFSANGVFGVTTMVGSNRIPIVTLLAAASDFLRRALPAPALHQSSAHPARVFPHAPGRNPADREAQALLQMLAFPRRTREAGGFQCRR